MLGGVFLKRAHHARDVRIVDCAPRAARRDIMIGDTKGETWLGDPRAAGFELAEGVERSLMHVMAAAPQHRPPRPPPPDCGSPPQVRSPGPGGLPAGRAG